MPLSKRTRVLLLLTVHNAGIVLLTHRSRLGSLDDLYLPSTAVLYAEFIKAFISWMALAHDFRVAGYTKGGQKPGFVLQSFYKPMKEALVQKQNELLLLSVPAAIYAAQNNLLYIGLSNLSATVYQVTYQLRILSTAAFSVFYFHHRFSQRKWAALALLTIGVAIVQIPDGTRVKQANVSGHNRLLGFSAILVACVSSGVAGCYFEVMLARSVLKNVSGTPKTNSRSASSLAMRNLQLAIASIPFDIFAILVSSHDRFHIINNGFFHNYTPLTCFVILNQAVGGLLIAAVVKEADSVSKGFATSAAVILSTLVTSLITKTLPSLFFIIGATMVVFATIIFAA